MWRLLQLLRAKIAYLKIAGKTAWPLHERLLVSGFCMGITPRPCSALRGWSTAVDQLTCATGSRLWSQLYWISPNIIQLKYPSRKSGFVYWAELERPKKISARTLFGLITRDLAKLFRRGTIGSAKDSKLSNRQQKPMAKTLSSSRLSFRHILFRSHRVVPIDTYTVGGRHSAISIKNDL